MSAAPDPVPCTFCSQRIEDPRRLVCACQAPYHIRCWTMSRLRCAVCGGKSYSVTPGPPFTWRDAAGLAVFAAMILFILGLIAVERGALTLPWPAPAPPPPPSAPAPAPPLTPEAPG